ncbi:kinase-like protein [Parathielavia appendiculata]|uniref:non-specific serine/threonine protein kinase n=1 Tax=Parathielavia appendiculata TaxID=2587402 RepID=A0AAN6Z104_9PEZI|nr:kinase-like protein [Parathielavia appendiculata]
MEPQPPRQPMHRPSHPRLHNIFPPPPSHLAQRTANSTPVSSPGLFSPSVPRPNMAFPSQPGSELATPGASSSPSPWLLHPQLHPLQGHKVRETHKANVEHDYTTGRKHINNYEIIEELGRGIHGKVKLARNVENGEFVAIKIIPRFSKKRRLGKVTAMSTQDKSKREIAILKKIRHPNVVALLEVIDDPELKKIYMVLEHVELGEIVWRKKGLPHICEYERRRVEREMRGAKPTPEEDRFERLLLQRQAAKDVERARVRATAQRSSTNDYWSLEYGPAGDEELDSQVGSLGREDSGLAAIRPSLSNSSSLAGSRATSRAPSRSHSNKSLSRIPESSLASASNPPDLETQSALSIPSSLAALDGSMYGPYVEDPAPRATSPSMADDSLMSQVSSFDFSKVHDPYVDDFSYVPCFTMEQARNTFRDTVLGLEYLHYEGVVHRDIKPANLLWTKDKRTKIADFGVSYFGRPVRDGEPDDTISESEARDFDNDLELAKTVGTPAFFAPELCATDLYDAPPSKQPRVTEQIDVWSLGVTLYCLIFARLPFLAEDEWQMFRKIANEEVYIPDRRLRPVDPATKPSEKSLYTRVNMPPYRDDDELAYEDIEPELQDLLNKMLTKNPDKRIRLRNVKRHPWVTQGVDIMSWIDDTDPSRRTSGKKIQVDEKDMARAVVPLSLMERARSVVKKAVGKVMHPRGDRTESVSSRRRAASSAASSAGESSAAGLVTPHLRDARRRSLRPDDYFSSAAQPTGGHPLTHSVLASPEEEPVSSPSASHQTSPGGGHLGRRPLELLTSLPTISDFRTGQASASPHREPPRHGHARSVTTAFLALTPAPMEIQTLPPTPLIDSPREDPSTALRKARDMKPNADEVGRARSVDRGLFASDDKRAEARVSLSVAVAPGNVHFTPSPRHVRSIELVKGLELAASAVTSPTGSRHPSHQHSPFRSDPNMHGKQRALAELEERLVTPRREKGLFRPGTPQRSVQKPSTPEPIDPALIPCPPSPDDETFPPMPLSRGETIATGKSSSSTSIDADTTPLTSPSESASPIYGLNNQMTKDVADRMLAFQSDPSLPALLSSTSSVSADLEGEFLGNPGVVHHQASVIDTTDSLTPPAFSKEPMSGFPLLAHDVPEGAVHVKLDHAAAAAAARAATEHPGKPAVVHRRGSRSCREEENDDNDSDSDEGLTMARRKRKPAAEHGVAGSELTATPARDGHLAQTHSVERLIGSARRRDTNASVGSTETAKKVFVDSE